MSMSTSQRFHSTAIIWSNSPCINLIYKNCLACCISFLAKYILGLYRMEGSFPESKLLLPESKLSTFFLKFKFKSSFWSHCQRNSLHTKLDHLLGMDELSAEKVSFLTSWYKHLRLCNNSVLYLRNTERICAVWTEYLINVHNAQ